LDMRQRLVGYMLEQLGEFVLRSKLNALDRELTDPERKKLDTFKVEWPELTVKDTTKYAAALQQVTSAVVAAIADQLLTRETGVRLIAAMAERLGVEIDAKAELEAALAEEPLDAGAHAPPPDDGENLPTGAGEPGNGQ